MWKEVLQCLNHTAILKLAHVENLGIKEIKTKINKEIYKIGFMHAAIIGSYRKNVLKDLKVGRHCKDLYVSSKTSHGLCIKNFEIFLLLRTVNAPKFTSKDCNCSFA